MKRAYTCLTAKDFESEFFIEVGLDIPAGLLDQLGSGGRPRLLWLAAFARSEARPFCFIRLGEENDLFQVRVSSRTRRFAVYSSGADGEDEESVLSLISFNHRFPFFYVRGNASLVFLRLL